jgi:hypothetical protein
MLRKAVPVKLSLATPQPEAIGMIPIPEGPAPIVMKAPRIRTKRQPRLGWQLSIRRAADCERLTVFCGSDEADAPDLVVYSQSDADAAICCMTYPKIAALNTILYMAARPQSMGVHSKGAGCRFGVSARAHDAAAALKRSTECWLASNRSRASR